MTNPSGVHEYVALAAADLLSAVVSSRFAADPGRLGGLGVHDASAGVRFST
jgi:hypothetical protein